MTGPSPTPPSEPDPRERYGRIFHEQGRLTVNAERAKRFNIEPWEDRTWEQREIDERGASAVAAQAVADAGIDLDALRGHRLAAVAEQDRLKAAIAQVIRLAESWKMQGGLLDVEHVAGVLLNELGPWTGDQDRSDEKGGQLPLPESP